MSSFDSFIIIWVHPSPPCATHFNCQLSLILLALATLTRVSVFSGTAPESLRLFVTSGRRSIQQPQQSRSAASTGLFMSELFMSEGLTSMADDTEEVPLRSFSSSNSYNSNINHTRGEGFKGRWVDTLYAELSRLRDSCVFRSDRTRPIFTCPN
jgi:hypothetical protein